MRRSRRGLSGGQEFGGSGEDSFVAVVVTKLTGALLFILLLTMVIMALIPKADEAARAKSAGETPPRPLKVATTEMLPDAIAGRPYAIALAAEGGLGKLHWAVDGKLPEGLALDADSGQIRGTPKAGTAEPADLVVRVNDGRDRAASRVRMVVFQSDTPLSTPSKWRPALPPIAWKSWMEQGFGFLVLMMVHLVGMNAVSGLERISSDGEDAKARGRFSAYRWTLRLATVGACAGLAFWLVRGRA